MAQNLMKYVEKLHKDYMRGMPDGLDEEYFKQIPLLFARIDELERALLPFAQTANRERKYGKELVEVYVKDCENAYDMVALEKARELPEPEIYYPAQ